MSLNIQQALATSNSSEGFIIYSKSPVRSMNTKEHHIKDIVYFMHDNKPTKGVVIGECKQHQIQLDIKNEFDLIQCINSDYTAREHTMVSNGKFNKVVIINSNGEDDEYVPINDWIDGSDIYDDVNDLFCSLLDAKL